MRVEALVVVGVLLGGCRSPTTQMRLEPCSTDGVKADVSPGVHRAGGRKLTWLFRTLGIHSEQMTIRVCNGSGRAIHVWTDSMIDGRAPRSGDCGDGSQVELAPRRALVVTVAAASAEPESFRTGWMECPLTGPSSCHLVWAE
jgi:hypothetical protein